MRGLMVAVIGMGVLIVAGVTALVLLMVQRMSAPLAPIASAPIASGPMAGPVATVLDEPEGTRMVGSEIGGDRLAIQLGGGGPDRIVIVDTRAGRVIARVALSPVTGR